MFSFFWLIYVLKNLDLKLGDFSGVDDGLGDEGGLALGDVSLTGIFLCWPLAQPIAVVSLVVMEYLLRSLFLISSSVLPHNRTIIPYMMIHLLPRNFNSYTFRLRLSHKITDRSTGCRSNGTHARWFVADASQILKKSNFLDDSADVWQTPQQTSYHSLYFFVYFLIISRSDNTLLSEFQCLLSDPRWLWSGKCWAK